MTTTYAAARRTNEHFLKDVLAGLSQPQKRLPSKYFYDAAGSRLQPTRPARASALTPPIRLRRERTG